MINTDCSQLRDRHDLFERRAVLRATLGPPHTNAAAYREAEPQKAAAAGTRDLERRRRSPARAKLNADHKGRRAGRKNTR